ncbi:MAG: hypothetical protein AAF419_03800 [Pseudomonadota bacterium]
MIFNRCSSIFLLSALFTFSVYASSTYKEGEFDDVEKTEVTSKEEREKLSITAGLLAKYEIEANKLIESLFDVGLETTAVKAQAQLLIELSTDVIESARFRLPQCEIYLTKTLELKTMLEDISHESLEKNYHADGALPKAPAECYHTKDLLVHPATVIVLTRDDPALKRNTRGTIVAEINEVLAHTEIVRELVVY